MEEGFAGEVRGMDVSEIGRGVLPMSLLVAIDVAVVVVVVAAAAVVVVAASWSLPRCGVEEDIMTVFAPAAAGGAVAAAAASSNFIFAFTIDIRS